MLYFPNHIFSLNAANLAINSSFRFLTDQNTTAFKEVAIIRHPRHGEYAFGFITSSLVLQVNLVLPIQQKLMTTSWFQFFFFFLSFSKLSVVATQYLQKDVFKQENIWFVNETVHSSKHNHLFVHAQYEQYRLLLFFYQCKLKVLNYKLKDEHGKKIQP